MIVHIAQEGIGTVDLFRRPGNPTDIRHIINRLSKGKQVIYMNYSFYTLASVIKVILFFCNTTNHKICINIELISHSWVYIWKYDTCTGGINHHVCRYMGINKITYVLPWLQRFLLRVPGGVLTADGEEKLLQVLTLGHKKDQLQAIHE